MTRLPIRLALAAATLAACAGARAADNAQVAQALAKNGCQGCHAEAGNVSGPSYHDIAARYVNRPDARSTLAGRIRNGSANNWGAAAMPPTPQIDELDLKAIVEWLASGAAPLATR